MRITAALRAHLEKQFGLSSGASDDDAKALLREKVASRELSIEKLAELSADTDARSKLSALVKESVEEAIGAPRRRSGVAMSSLLAGDPRVKAESEKYLSGSNYVIHKSGYVPTMDSKPVELASDRTRAKAGAWFKSWVRRQAVGCDLPPLSEHELGLVKEMAHDGLWCGPDSGAQDGWSFPRKLRDYEVKALIGDTGTGGSYLYPIEFDALAVTYPLLNGELFPFVDLQSASHTSIQTPTINTPTVLWNDSTDGGTATLFSATGLVSQLSTSFFPVSCFIEIGRDLLSDSAIDIAAILEQQIGQAMLTELDKVIAIGDGTSQPLGLFNTVGATAVPSANGTNGPLTIGDAEALMFALPKQYRAGDTLRTCYVSSDTTYRRFRGVPVGPDDARRLFGMDHASYMMLDRPYRVQQSIADTKAAFVALAKYRMFRRQGFESRFTDQGITLFKSNTALLSIRGRFGGRMVDPAAVAVMADAPNMDS
ncbi:MAG: phage major capsid protein [Pirellulales bacterium]